MKDMLYIESNFYKNIYDIKEIIHYTDYAIIVIILLIKLKI